jgi:hypothetical protein
MRVAIQTTWRNTWQLTELIRLLRQTIFRAGMVYSRVSSSRWVNSSPIEEQNGRRTELLGAKVQYLKHMAIEIGEETKHQIDELKVLES